MTVPTPLEYFVDTFDSLARASEIWRITEFPIEELRVSREQRLALEALEVQIESQREILKTLEELRSRLAFEELKTRLAR